MLALIEGMAEGIGQVTANLGESFIYIWERRIHSAHVAQQVASIGFDSLPIALIINLVSGCVLALNAADKFAMTGATAYVGSLVAMATVREMAPIFTALGVGARAGTAISAEIANMGVTNQLDALQVMRVSPIRYLMVPRVLACIICMPMMTLLSEAVGILGAMIVTQAEAHIHYAMFLDSVWLSLKWYDIEISLIKAVVFGIILAGISVTVGLNTKGGARQVGLATTQATVWTAICVLIADFLMTWMFFGTSFVN